MADPVEGTYVIISVGSGLAVDVKGASDKSGVNVIQWTPNNGDAQIWALTKPENTNWQIVNSLSGKCLDVAGSTPASGANVRQYDDTDNLNTQRWTFATTGSNYTYKSKSYPTYYIRSAGNSNLVLDVSRKGTTAGSNIDIYTNSSANNQKWILVPVKTFTNEGSYQIRSAADTSMCVTISAASTANSATAIIDSNYDGDNQAFWIDQDDEEFTVVFKAQHSQKVLDIKGGTAKDSARIIQYTRHDGLNQVWLPVQSGSVKYGKTTYPTFDIRSQAGASFSMDVLGGKASAKTSLGIYTRNNKINQRFFFVKVEPRSSVIAAPTALTPTLFTRENAGSITVSGLKFKGPDNDCQARYKVRTYTANKASYTETAWKALDDDSTSRSGWGDAYTKTFTATAGTDGYRALPFNKTFSLDATNRSIDIYIQVRGFRQLSYGKAHGEAKQTIIQLRQKPTISLSSISMTASDKAVGLTATLGSPSGYAIEILRGRILGEDGLPITDWDEVAGANKLDFNTDGALYRFPEEGEVLTFEYSVLTDEDVLLTDSSAYTFAYSAGSLNPSNPVVTYPEDDSCTATVSSNVAGKCFIEVSDSRCSRLVECEASGTNQWRCLPPLNQETNVYVVSYSGSNAVVKSSKCEVHSHLFIWNWADNSAAILINSEKPPQQNRSFTTDIQYNKPTGRFYPVGFASKYVTGDLSVTGVVIDEDAQYVSSGPIPENTTLPRIKSLIPLSGQGIHPIYRTPYGDWYQVAIENVDFSKQELDYTNVSVKQSALED